MANGLFNLKQVMQGIQQGGWPAQKTPAVEYLVVAGGAGAARGGGGAGGLLQGIDPVPNGQTLLVTVGSGGSGTTVVGSTPGNSGGNSVFGNIIATGGGGGGAGSYTGIAGGSGGGVGSSGVAGTPGSGGSGVLNQGNAGGSLAGFIADPYPSGGGGGAGTVGLNAASSTVSGNGGAGIASSISGTVTTYAGGGGGGNYSGTGTVGIGGVGGGGSGSLGTNGGNGTANTGGGGGGAGVSATGGNGGSGIVIVSYPDVYAAPTATTGSPTVSTSGSGSINFASAGYLATGAGTAPTQAGDFTLECWLNLSTFNQSGGYAICGGTTSGANFWGFKNSNSMLLATSSTGVETLFSCTLPSTNTWFHFCFIRSGSTVYAFLNGVLQSSSSWSGSLFAAGSLLVGGYGSGVYICPGYMTNLRVTNTVVYATSGFTPPTAPLTRITGTALLMNMVSGAYTADATSTYSFTNVSTAPTWNASSPFTVTGYKNRVYTWTSSGSITF